MALIPADFIDTVVSRVDIVSLISDHVPLKRSGKNYFGLCPFHKENTPSFSVSYEKQIYYCFGCGASGDALEFLMEHEKMSFFEAVKRLANKVGMQIPRTFQNVQHYPKKQKRDEQVATLKLASDFYSRSLLSEEGINNAIDYLSQRKLTATTIRDFGIGYAPDGWNNLADILYANDSRLMLEQDARLRKQKLNKMLQESGLQVFNDEKKTEYDRFRKRIMFPIKDLQGRIVAFGGRTLGNEKPKYLNSPETDVFSKSRTLYGLYQALKADRRPERIIVLEGYFDVVTLHQAGVTNAVATMGTSISEEHLHLLFRHTSEVVFCYDGDAAGRVALERAFHVSVGVVDSGKTVRFLKMPASHDPDSFVVEHGANAFDEMVKSSQVLSEYIFDLFSMGLDLKKIEDKGIFSRKVGQSIAKMQPGVLPEMLWLRLSELTGLRPEVLKEMTTVDRSSRELSSRPRAANTTGYDALVNSIISDESITVADQPRNIQDDTEAGVSDSVVELSKISPLSLLNNTVSLNDEFEESDTDLYDSEEGSSSPLGGGFFSEFLNGAQQAKVSPTQTRSTSNSSHLLSMAKNRPSITNKLIFIMANYPELVRGRQLFSLSGCDASDNLLSVLWDYFQEEGTSIGTLVVDWQVSESHQSDFILLKSILEGEAVPIANDIMMAEFESLLLKVEANNINSEIKRLVDLSKQVTLTQEQQVELASLLKRSHHLRLH